MIDRYSKIIKDFVDDAVTLTSASPSSDQETLDEPTVAVLERLNLHEALVRIPMYHGDLGPSSQVGHADHLCSRRMNQVPLSDFFASSSAERESQMDPRQLKAILWMNDMPIATRGANSRRTEETDTQRECHVGTEPKLTESEDPHTHKMSMAPHERGMSVSDPTFILLALGFLICIRLSSAFW